MTSNDAHDLCMELMKADAEDVVIDRLKDVGMWGCGDVG